MAHNPAIQQLRAPAIIPLILSTSKLNNLAMEGLYVFNDQGQMVAPWSSEPVSSSDGDASGDVNWGQWRDEVERLDHIEFVDKDITKAIEGYTILQNEHLPASLQAQLLKSIADGYRKLHQIRLAEANYMKLAREYDEIVDPDGLPMGILARQLVIRLYDQNKEADNAFDTRMEILEGLILQRWKIPASRRDLLEQDLRASLRQALASHASSWSERRARWERLQTLKNHVEDLKVNAETFAKQMWPDLSRRLRQRGWVEQGGVLELTGGPNSEKAVAVIAPILTSGNELRRGSLVAILKGDSLWPTLEQTLNEYAQPVGLRVSWDHSSTGLSSQQHSSLALWKSQVERSVNGMDPPGTFSSFRVEFPGAKPSFSPAIMDLWRHGGALVYRYYGRTCRHAAGREARNGGGQP